MYPPQLNGGDRAFYPQPEGHSFYPSDRYAQPLPHWVLAAPHWVPTTHWVPVLVSDASQMTVMAPPVVGLPTNPMPMPSSPVIPVPAPQWAQPRWAPPADTPTTESTRCGAHAPDFVPTRLRPPTPSPPLRSRRRRPRGGVKHKTRPASITLPPSDTPSPASDSDSSDERPVGYGGMAAYGSACTPESQSPLASPVRAPALATPSAPAAGMIFGCTDSTCAHQPTPGTIRPAAQLSCASARPPLTRAPFPPSALGCKNAPAIAWRQCPRSMRPLPPPSSPAQRSSSSSTIRAARSALLPFTARRFASLPRHAQQPLSVCLLR